MRSLLLVPVADAGALEAALGSGADALVLDLGDPGPGREAVRHAALDLLRSSQWRQHRPHLYVRLAGLEGPWLDDDLAALVPGEPDGLLLAGARHGADVQHLGAKLAVHEADHGLAEAEIGIIAEAGASAQGLFGLGSYGGASPRLVGLAWHAAALAADLGSDPEAFPAAGFPPFETVRHLTLFGARAAGVAAIDAASPAATDDVFRAECQAARRYGFNAKVAATPAQAAVINAIFGHDED